MLYWLLVVVSVILCDYSLCIDLSMDLFVLYVVWLIVFVNCLLNEFAIVLLFLC